MFDWLGDLFNTDTFNTLSNGFDTMKSGYNAAAPYVQGGLGLLNGIDSYNRSKSYSQGAQQGLDSLQGMFSENSPYAQTLRAQLNARDAAAGRRSQYGPREVELQAALANKNASLIGSPQYQALLAGANRSPYAGLMGSLGQMFSLRDKNGNFKTPPGTSQALNYLSDSLFQAAPDSAIAGLGGANSALANGSLGTPDALGSLAGGNGMLPTYQQAGGPDATGVFNTAAGLTGDLGVSQGLGGAAGAVAGGMGSGALGGTVGGADALGGMLGGSGFLPSYGAAAGAGGTSGAAGGLFGGGASAAGLAAIPGWAYGPLGIAVGGMLGGIFGKADGPGYSNRDNANTMAMNLANIYQLGTNMGQTADVPDWLSSTYKNNAKGEGMSNFHIGAPGTTGSYYNGENPTLQAYLTSKYGNGSANANGQGGYYTEDQYGDAYKDLQAQYGALQAQGGAFDQRDQG